jgi:hypothetical protein
MVKRKFRYICLDFFYNSPVDVEVEFNGVILCNFPNEFPCFFYSAPFIISCVTKFTNIEIFNIHYQINV